MEQHLQEEEHHDAEELHGVDARRAREPPREVDAEPRAGDEDDAGEKSEVKQRGSDGSRDRRGDAHEAAVGVETSRLLVGVGLDRGLLARGKSLYHGGETLDHDARAHAEHEAEAEALPDGRGLRHGADAERGQPRADAQAADDRATEPHERGHDADEEAHGEHHRRVVESQRHAGDRRGVAEVLREDAEHVPEQGVDGREAHAAKEEPALRAARVRRRLERLGGGYADGVREALLADEVRLEHRAGGEAEDRSGERGRKHLDERHVRAAEHPQAGDGEGEAARHHGPRAHGRVADVGLMQVVTAKEAKRAHARKRREDDRPGKRAETQRDEERACGENRRTERADDERSRRQGAVGCGRVTGISCHGMPSLRIAAGSMGVEPLLVGPVVPVRHCTHSASARGGVF